MQRTEKYFENDAFRKTAAGGHPGRRGGRKDGRRAHRAGRHGVLPRRGRSARRQRHADPRRPAWCFMSPTSTRRTASSGTGWMPCPRPHSPVPSSPAPSTGSGASTRCSSTPASTSSPASCTRCSGRRTWASISAPTPCGWTPASPSPPRACGGRACRQPHHLGECAGAHHLTPTPKSWRH